jgi:TM2 domain-containing membrane protein YozV
MPARTPLRYCVRVMKSGLAVVLALVIGQLAFAAPAWAQTAPAPQPAPPTNPWQAPPSQTYQTPPPGYPPSAGPPPGYPPPPPGYGGPYYYYGPNNQMTYANYEAQKKNAGLALLVEFLVPGLGSFYGDHGLGALITWTLMITGVVLLVVGANQWVDDVNAENGSEIHSSTGNTEMIAGLLMILGGRIYGFVDAYQSSEEYNRKLRARLGLPPGFVIGVGPVGRGSMSIGPHLGFTF